VAPKRTRAELLQAIRSGFQQTSGQSVLLSQVIADKVGLAPSDLECLGYLEDGGPMTAGRLSELTGLTTGAVTRMVDRLGSAKYVRRRSDPDDRRKVIIELVPDGQRSSSGSTARWPAARPSASRATAMPSSR